MEFVDFGVRTGESVSEKFSVFSFLPSGAANFFENEMTTDRASDSFLNLMDWFKLTYTLLGGLGIFFFGMKELSEVLQALGSQWIRKTINTLTNNRIIAVLVGLSVTCFVQSSSITTVMVVGFVNAGLMELSQAIGVIFGANIGTTITGWIISIKIGKYSLLLVGVGFLPMLFSKDEGIGRIGRLLFALGMVFLGLSLMSGSFKPLRSNDGFLQMMQLFDANSYLSLWATVAMGCALTFMIQSSSAMLGITIALASSGAISFQTALALVMGENIGTTITALLASIGANTAARRAGLAHAVFNVLGVIMITSVFHLYKDFIEYLINGAADFSDADGLKPYITAHIAAGHTIFNVVNVLLFLPFLPLLERLVVWIIPDKKYKEKPKLEFFGSSSELSPALAIGQAKAELKKMAKLVDTVFEDSCTYLNSAEERSDLYKRVKKYENITDKIQMEMTVFLGTVMEARLTAEETQKVKSILRMADELESITDYCYSIVIYAKRSFSDQQKFDQLTKDEIFDLSQKSHSLYKKIHYNIEMDMTMDLSDFIPRWNHINEMAEQMKERHLERLADGKFPPVASLTLSDIVVSIRRIKNHMVNLAEAYVRAQNC